MAGRRNIRRRIRNKNKESERNNLIYFTKDESAEARRKKEAEWATLTDDNAAYADLDK